ESPVVVKTAGCFAPGDTKSGKGSERILVTGRRKIASCLAMTADGALCAGDAARLARCNDLAGLRPAARPGHIVGLLPFVRVLVHLRGRLRLLTPPPHQRWDVDGPAHAEVAGRKDTRVLRVPPGAAEPLEGRCAEVVRDTEDAAVPGTLRGLLTKLLHHGRGAHREGGQEDVLLQRLHAVSIGEPSDSRITAART